MDVESAATIDDAINRLQAVGEHLIEMLLERLDGWTLTIADPALTNPIVITVHKP